MATRLYLPSSGASSISPAFAGGWELTTGAVRRQANTTKSSTAFSNTGIIENNASTSYDVAVAQYVFGPLAAQTITGNVKGQIRALESESSADMRAQTIIRVIASDGTVRGTLLDFDVAALSSEFAISNPANRRFPRGGSVALSSVAAQAGDFIVIELGYRSHNNSTSNRTGTLRFGDNSGSDLAEDEASTTDNNPWIEFDTDISVQSAAVLTAEAGSYSITGQTAGTYFGHVVAADAGSYGITGQDAGLYFGARATGEAAAYTLAGQDISLLTARLLAAAAGSYSIEGVDAALTKSYNALTAEMGSYTLTGENAGLLLALQFQAEAGNYTISGQAAGTLAGWSLGGEAGIYTLSGAAANLFYGRLSDIVSGEYNISGQDAGYSLSRRIAAETGAYTLSGQEAVFARDIIMEAEAAAYIITGFDVELLRFSTTLAPISRTVRVPIDRRTAKLGDGSRRMLVLPESRNLKPICNRTINIPAENRRIAV